MDMNKTTTDFVAAILAQEGVPFAIQGRNAFNVLDCVGVVAVPAAMVGVVLEPIEPYRLNCDYSGRLYAYFQRNFDVVPLDAFKIGDVLLFWLAKPSKPRHIGTVLPGTNQGAAFNFMHTSESAGKVVQNALSVRWISHIHSAWRLRGLD